MPLSRFSQRKWWRIALMLWKQSQHNALTTYAASLTFSTVLAIVPVLTLILALTRGFNLEQLIETELRLNLNVQEEVINTLMEFANSYLARAQEGTAFLIVVIAMLFFTLVSLIVNIEETFNAMWGLKKSRNLMHFSLSYIGLFFVSLFVIGLLSVIWYSVQEGFKWMMGDIPISGLILVFSFASKWILTTIVIGVMFKAIPYTKVRWNSTYLPALLSGFFFCGVQEFFVHGQIFLSGYNAIYGSFAALPLLMLSLFVVWTILLVGVQLCQVIQHTRLLGDELSALPTDRHSRDVIALWLVRHAARRFVSGQPSCSLNDFASASLLSPILVEEELNRLVAVEVLFKYLDEQRKEEVYKINTDIYQLTIARLFELLDKESPSYDFPQKEHQDWQQLSALRSQFSAHHDWQQLVKDL